jgi:hypothetical protein
VFTAVQVKTHEDEIHSIIAKAKAEGRSSRRGSRSTQPLGNIVKKANPRQTAVEEGDEAEQHNEGAEVGHPLRYYTCASDVLTAVQVKTKEDEIHELIAKVAAGGSGLRRDSRMTRSSRHTMAKKVDPRQINEENNKEDDEEEDEEDEEEEEEEDEDEDEDEEDDDEDSDYQGDDDKEDDYKEDDDNKQDDDKEEGDKEEDERRDHERSDEGSDYDGDYEGDYDGDYEAKDDEAIDNEEVNDYEMDEAPHSAAKRTQNPRDYAEHEINRILAERHVGGQREYLVDLLPSWTPHSSLPAPLLDEWTKNSNNHTSQRSTNTLPKVQPPKTDDEDALMWQLIEAILHNFGAYMYPDPSQSTAADELARQLFRDGDWTFHPNPAHLRLLSRHLIEHNEQGATAAQTLRRAFLAALRHKYAHPSDLPTDHGYDDIQVQYTGDICTPPRSSSSQPPQPVAGVPVHSLIYPLFGLLWDLQSPHYDGSYADRAELPAHLNSLQGIMDKLISTCPYLLTQPWPLAFISLFRWGNEVGARFEGVAPAFWFVVDGAVEKRYRDQIVDVMVEQAGLEDGRWSGEQVWRAFRAAQGYVREMSGGSIGAVGKEKTKGARGSGKGGERKRKTEFKESGAEGKRRRVAKGAGKAAGKKGN